MMGMLLSLLYRCQYLDCHFVFTAVDIILQSVITEGNWIKGTRVHVLCYFSTISHNYFRI